MDWAVLFGVEGWSSLRSVPVESVHVGGVLYRCGHQAFLLAVPYRQDFVADPTAGPFVTAVVWAASEGAARRVFLMQTEMDDGASGTVPSQFLPPHVRP